MKEKSRIGTILDGKYEILREIGHGGMSIVYLAMDVKLNKQWAIKEIRKNGSNKENQIFVNSFIAEANLMKNLDHPALPRIVDIIDDGTNLFVIMDYIEGDTLSEYINREGLQPMETVIDWAKQICDVLKYLHSQTPPIIYRDMKPNNVMRKPDGKLKVIDFGIAKEYKADGQENTSLLGTKGYASPEQMTENGQIDIRSDIFSFGATLFYLVTKKSPYAEPACLSYLVSRYNPDYYGTGLEMIIEKCVQQRKEDRYQDCTELMYDLEHYNNIIEIGALRRHLILFSTAGIFCILMLVLGISLRVLAGNEDSRVYEQKIGISESTDYNTKVRTYAEAIRLLGDDTRAYEKLLQAYEDNGVFGDEESNQFTAYYNEFKNEFDTESIEYLELNYKIGTTYFYLYTGGDAAFRTRVLKAVPYFETIVESKNTTYENYNLSNSYYILCNFYKQYINSNSSGMIVREPKQEDYMELLDSMNTCIDNMEGYENDESSYIKLIMYHALNDLLNDHRSGFVSTGVAKEDVMKTMENIREKSDSLAVTQEASLNLQKELDTNYELYVQNLERAYSNAEERSS